jgi:hypothetical protein
MTWEITNYGKSKDPLLEEFEKEIIEFMNDSRNQDDNLWESLAHDKEYQLTEDDISHIKNTNLINK